MHGAVKETTGDFLNLSDFPRDQYPKHYTTAHSQNYVNQSINQSRSCQQIHIKVTLYKPFNPSCLHNFNRASVKNKEYKISHATGFHFNGELHVPSP